jgi:hypothetical protein
MADNTYNELSKTITNMPSDFIVGSSKDALHSEGECNVSKSTIHSLKIMLQVKCISLVGHGGIIGLINFVGLGFVGRIGLFGLTGLNGFIGYISLIGPPASLATLALYQHCWSHCPCWPHWLHWLHRSQWSHWMQRSYWQRYCCQPQPCLHHF